MVFDERYFHQELEASEGEEELKIDFSAASSKAQWPSPTKALVPVSSMDLARFDSSQTLCSGSEWSTPRRSRSPEPLRTRSFSFRQQLAPFVFFQGDCLVDTASKPLVEKVEAPRFEETASIPLVEKVQAPAFEGSEWEAKKTSAMLEAAKAPTLPSGYHGIKAGARDAAKALTESGVVSNLEKGRASSAKAGDAKAASSAKAGDAKADASDRKRAYSKVYHSTLKQALKEGLDESAAKDSNCVGWVRYQAIGTLVSGHHHDFFYPKFSCDFLSAPPYIAHPGESHKFGQGSCSKT